MKITVGTKPWTKVSLDSLVSQDGTYDVLAAGASVQLGDERLKDEDGREKSSENASEKKDHGNADRRAQVAPERVDAAIKLCALPLNSERAAGAPPHR
jgi:hypothetical protein